MMPEEREAKQGEGQDADDGWAIYAAQAVLEGLFEQKHSRPSSAVQDAQAPAQAYRDAAAEMIADPLFDLDSGHGLSSDNTPGQG